MATSGDPNEIADATDTVEKMPAREESSASTPSDPSGEGDVSKVSGIRVVPFQQTRFPVFGIRRRRKTRALRLKHFHDGKLQKIDGDRVKYEDLCPPNEGMLDHYKGRIRGFSGRGVMETIDATYESFSYVAKSSILQRVHREAKKLESRMCIDFSHEFKRVSIIVLISYLTASAAAAIDQFIKLFSGFKYETLKMLYDRAYLTGEYHKPFLFGALWNTFFAFMAGLCIFISPVAQGSGIPQIKCYLNGIKVPKVVRIKTFICKTVGVIMSVVGGFPVGKEGPMIHSGAAIGAGVSQGKSTSLRFTSSIFREFRNDRDKRDFVACGAAAGVAAAFGAPIGGILFAFEEGASHFSPNFIWRLSVGSYLSYVFLQFYRSFFEGIPGQLSNGGLISFGRFSDATYSLHSLSLAVVIGIFAAVSGCLFNLLNLRITQIRMRYLNNSKWRKLLEVVLTGFFIGASAFALMLMGGQCERDVDFDETTGIADEVVYRLNCTFSRQSSSANLWYKTPEDLLKALFHDEINTHNWQTLALFAPVYWLLSCFTYGLAISNGLFIPCLLIGAVWGRCVGLFFITNVPFVKWGSVGDYALIGACAQLAGTVRLSYSLTVIVLECIGNNTYILPIFMTTLIAKHLGDAYNSGIYHMHIELAGVPILEDEPQMRNSPITAQQVMSDHVSFLPIRAKVKDVVTLLRTTSHNAYPVVDTLPKPDGCLPSYGRLRGVMARHDIITMINRRIICDGDGSGLTSPKEGWLALREAYPRYPTVESIRMSEQDQETYTLDFSLSMDLAPVMVSPNMLYNPLFDLFRNSGCSHAVVVNFEHEVVGVITRKDFVNIQRGHPSIKAPPALKRKPIVIPVSRKGGPKNAFQGFCRDLWNACFSGRSQHEVLVEDEGSPEPILNDGGFEAEDDPDRSATEEQQQTNKDADESNKSDSSADSAGGGPKEDSVENEGVDSA